MLKANAAIAQSEFIGGYTSAACLYNMWTIPYGRMYQTSRLGYVIGFVMKMKKEPRLEGY